MAKKERIHDGSVKLEMTPMIDVVFQLLIFFIVALKQDDILSHLDISRPAPHPDRVQIEGLIKIEITDQGFAVHGRRVEIKDLDRQLMRISKFNRNISIVIKCAPDSRHSNLVKLLDMCAKAGLTNLSVFST